MEELEDLRIEISSDSDKEEAGPGLQAPRLNGLHDRQQRASLRLGPRSDDGFPNTEITTYDMVLSIISLCCAFKMFIK